MAKKGHCQGPWCDNLLPTPAHTGRPRKYCSADCREQAYRYRRSKRLAAASAEKLRIESYPNKEMILDRILNDRFTAEELIEILTVVENQFIAERIRRTRLTNPGNVWLGLQELAAVEMQLRRILRKIKDYQSRQPRQDGR